MKANLYPGRGVWPDWNDPDIRQREQMPAHAYRIPFPDLASCRHAVSDNRRNLSPYIINLDQGWESRFYTSILQLPENILSFRSGFEPASVPGGQSEASELYDAAGPERSAGYPFPVTPPHVPSDIPVIVYRRTCHLPLVWSGLRKRLVLQGIRAACHIFINGRLAGYTQGSCLPAEFDLTAGLHDGDNELFLLVYPYCTGSYLERQDFAACFGLVRAAYLEAVPPIAIQDIRVRTSPEPEEEAWRLDLTVSLVSCRISTDSPQVRVSLWQDEECLTNKVWPVSLQSVDASDYASPVQTEGLLQASLLLPNIEGWSDESPRLYDLYISIEERGGRELLCTHQAIGFRQLTWQDHKPMINGRPLSLRAAQWQVAPTDSIRDMIRQIRQIKQIHLNALYICHFPADPILLELCDIFGLYVIDEAPLEISHPLMETEIGNEPAWREDAENRLERLIRRDYNHPCILFWSAGLFRQTGPLQDTLADFIRKLDDTRGLHLVDIPDIGRGLAAAPVPEWLPSPEGTCLCYYDWNRHLPVLDRELRQFLRPLDIRAIDAADGTFMIKNRLNWTPATQFDVAWRLLRDGKPVLSGEIDSIRTEPGSEQYMELAYGDQNFDDGSDYLISFQFFYADFCLWADAGEEAFFQEFPLSSADRSELPAQSRSGGRLRLEADRHHLIVSGSRFWLVFNRLNGALESWRCGDKELIAPPYAANGGIPGLHGTISRPVEPLDERWTEAWRQEGYPDLLIQPISSQEDCDGQTAVIEIVLQMAAPGRPACLEMLIRHEIRSSGDLRVFTSLSPLKQNQPPWPCFGLGLQLKPDYDQISWYGTGPYPCLSRLQNSRRCGLYRGGQVDPARGIRLPGNEPGYFPDTRWLVLKDQTGFGLLIRSDQLFGFSVRPAGKNTTSAGQAESRLDRQALTVQLYRQMSAGLPEKPVKSSWYFSPVASDAGKQPAEKA